jgi:hypothetical protein
VRRWSHHRKIPTVSETTKQPAFGKRLIVSSSPSATREMRSDDAKRKSSKLETVHALLDGAGKAKGDVDVPMS